MQSQTSYRFLSENEVDNLIQNVQEGYRALSQKYLDLYCQKHGIETKSKGLLKSFWYIVYFSNAYGENAEENLKEVLNNCQNPAAVRSFAYKLNKKHEKTMKVLRQCEQKGVEKRKESQLVPASIFKEKDRIFIEIPPANSRALQCQNLVDWFNGFLPQQESPFKLQQIEQTIQEKSANGIKIDRQVFDYRFLQGKQEKRIGKFLTTIQSDLKKMKEAFVLDADLKKDFLEFLKEQNQFDKRAFFTFKAKTKSKNLYLAEPVVFYQLKNIATDFTSFDNGLDSLIARYEREAAVLQEIETKKLSETETSQVADMIILSTRPIDIARKSTFTSWTSCNDVDGRYGTDYALKYIPDEVAAYSIVAYGVNKKNPSKPLCRCLINPYVNMASLASNNQEDKFYACDRMYGEIIPTLRLTLEDIIKNELNKDFCGTGVYDFKGHAPENCPMKMMFLEGKRVRDLETFMDTMKKEFGSVYNCTKLDDGRYFFDEFELFPDEKVDFEGAEIDFLRIPRLTPEIDIGKGIKANKVEIRKIFCEKMPKNLTMKTLIFDDASDQAHPEERVSIPHNISVEDMHIKSMHVTDVPSDLNVKSLTMNVVQSGEHRINPLTNFKTFNHIVVDNFSSDAGMTKDLLASIQVKKMLIIPNYKSKTLPEGIQSESIDLSQSQIKILPNDFKVCDIDVSESQLLALPANCEVKDFLWAVDCPCLKEIGDGFKCGGEAVFENTKIEKLPASMEVASLRLNDNPLLKEIPENVKIDNLKVEGFAGTIQYSPHYKSIVLKNCLPLIHPNIPNEVIKGATQEEIEKSKKEYQRRVNSAQLKRIQKEGATKG